jgi:3-(3-hydroxy-phenyl)propionate hydroxylase
MKPGGGEIHDVAVVGYGPVGALLASLLGRDGLRTLVFEREPEVYRLPRAVHFDHEVRRIFQSIGLGEDAMPETAPLEGVEFWNADREVLFRIGFDQAITQQGWRQDYMFHQPALEAVLRDAAARRDGVAVHLEHEVTTLEERDDHVALGVRDLASGELRTVRARYVVGCDGAGSFVRRRAGLTLDDLQFDEPWLVVDATVDRPRAELGLPGPAIQLCDPSRPSTFVPVAGPYVRWEFMLREGEARDEMLRPERVRERIAAWVDPRRVEVIRTAVYDFHALVARRWHTPRIFLAGDSAHQTPPFLGQGLCAGIRDAANLAWKLRLVLRGAARESILPSYQSEREPHVRALIGIAIDMGRIICTRDAEAAAARDAAFLGRPAREQAPPPMPGLGKGLWRPDSPLAGRPGLQARVRGRDGTPALLDDVVGPGFAVLTRGPEPPPLRAAARRVLDAVAGHAVPLGPALDVDGAYARWLDRDGCDAVLVRPDHVVFGTASGPDAASALLEELGRVLG